MSEVNDLIPAARTFLVQPNGRFSTIQAGINAAAALVPTAAAPALVRIAPGTYTENLTLAPFVWLSSLDPTSGPGSSAGYSVIVVGTVGYTAGAVATSDTFAMKGIRIDGVFTYNIAAKTGGFDNLSCNNCFFTTTGMVITGRAASPSSVTVRFVHTRLPGATFTDCNVLYSGIIGGALITTVGTGAHTAQNGSRFADVTLGGTTTLVFDSGGGFGASNTLTVGATATADVRKCRLGIIAGPGAINRDVIRGNTGALGAGAGQVVALAIPLMDANYSVLFTQTAGAAVTDPVLTARVAANFTVTIAAGGGTYDYTVIHD